MEAAIWNLPGIAVSLDAPEYHSGPLDYSTAAIVAAHVTEVISRKKLPNRRC
jgi:broad specificity polyphosphatase/5'/3'-nucleotidase SurE